MKLGEYRMKMLLTIMSHFNQSLDYIVHAGYYDRYLTKAEALIEIIEVLDCGSVGGHNPKRPLVKETGHMLYDRFLAVVDLHHTREEVKNDYYDLVELTERVKKLVESVN